MSERMQRLAAIVLLVFVPFAFAATTLVDLTANVQGLLPRTNGGTGVSSTATYPTSGTIPVLEVAEQKVGECSTIADSAGLNTTETIICQGSVIAANRLVEGTVLHISAFGVCTTTVANASTFTVRIGTAGTTSDGAIATLTTGNAGTTGTNVLFNLEEDIVIRTTGSSATVDARDKLFSGANGIQGSTTVQLGAPTPATFNSTTASQFIELTYKSAATTTTSTFKQVTISIVTK